MKSLFKITLRADKLFACLVSCGLVYGFAFNSIALAAATTGQKCPFAWTNPITVENCNNVGSTGWVLSSQNSGTAADDINGQIKGYMSATSVNIGESIDFRVTVNPVQTFTIEIYRVGWYGVDTTGTVTDTGTGGRLMTTIGPIQGITQQACTRGPDALAPDGSYLGPGLLECNWSPSYTLQVPTTWTSGIYLAKLKNAAGFDSGAIFVVRDDNRVANFLYEQPVNTYQAYNQYPEGVGSSLYGGDLSKLPKAVKVSFNRPYAGYNSNFNGYGHFLEEEINLVKWLESEGYDVAYTTTVDTDAHGERLLNYRGIISGGHSEYWTSGERNAYESARNGKVNLAFFGANAIYWQVRYEPATDGTANRTMVCYKDAGNDPIQDPALVTDHFRSSAVNRPEQALMGNQYITNNSFWNLKGWANLVVKNSSYWVYNGSSFTEGQPVPGIIGYEINNIQASYPLPASTESTIIADSPYVDSSGAASNSQAVIYRAQSATGAPMGWVFSSGTMAWSWALNYEPRLALVEGPPLGIDWTSPGLQTVTQNILDRFLNEPPVGLPVIDGIPLEYQTITADTSGISDYDGLGVFSYQWQRNGVNIAGATNASYTLGSADVGAQIAVVVTYTDGKGNLTILTSTTVLGLSAIPTGAVELQAANSGECVSVSGGSYAVNAKIVQNRCTKAQSQLWKLAPVGSAYHIVANNSGMCLNVPGASRSAGVQLIQWPCQAANNTNDQWTLTQQGGEYHIRSVSSGQ